MPGSHYHWLNEAPDLLNLARSFPDSFPFLLDSAASGPLGRHSMLLFADGECLVRHPDGCIEGPGRGNGIFSRLGDWYRAERAESYVAPDADGWEIPFVGGWFLFLAYEMAIEVESRLELPPNRSGLPDAIAQRCSGAIIVFHGDDGSPGQRGLIVAESQQVLEEISLRVESPGKPVCRALPLLSVLESEDPQKFKSDVCRVLEYLRAGDAFQVNISRPWRGQFVDPPETTAVYQRLRRSNPAPFAGFFQWGSAALLSSSPERLIQIRGRQVQTRPIAGTRPRGGNPDLDLALSRELIDNVKERAEHIMLIDLERNDLGRVCCPGTVEVNELMVLESYAHVHHIVSNVRGMLRQDVSPVQAIGAVFPGGTITGCPKVRCMEIIAELEKEGRGFYTGSIGYLGRNGRLDLNILIRTMLLQGKSVSFRTGAGIVADSEPGRELKETEDKARGLLMALQNDHREIRFA